VHAVRAQLSWRHYRELISIENLQKRAFYEQQAILHSWSYRELQKQIRSQLFEKFSPHEVEATFQIKLPAISSQEVFKDAYDFDFIELETHGSEKDLENQILCDFESFLKELGEDFAFLRRQAPIKIDGETHFIDLVLYHRGIPCVILVDLKIGKLDSRDIGQMNKYVEYYRRNRQYEHEKDTIGLIICREAGREEIVYALGGLEERIFVAEYKVKLPSKATIKKALKEL
jgi:predicted nuclease of restriction endonuclease-like (RecB) superfamily